LGSAVRETSQRYHRDIAIKSEREEYLCDGCTIATGRSLEDFHQLVWSTIPSVLQARLAELYQATAIGTDQCNLTSWSYCLPSTNAKAQSLVVGHARRLPYALFARFRQLCGKLYAAAAEDRCKWWPLSAQGCTKTPQTYLHAVVGSNQRHKSSSAFAINDWMQHRNYVESPDLNTHWPNTL
jgi:hypothetical protein